MKVLPPVRQSGDQQALWEALHTGVIDMISTDHAPHTANDKAQSIWEAASGAPGVETMLPLLLDAANKGKCSLAEIADWCSAAPAARFGLAGKGAITPGSWADITFVDMSRNWEIQPERLHTMAGGTPFAGWQGKGAPVLTLLRGKVVAREGAPIGEPAGQWARPCLSYTHGNV
jgi:dihydroorotase